MILGISTAVTEVSRAASDVVDTLNKGTVDQTKLQTLLQQVQIAQAEINKLEARHSSLFVSGWRPAIGWSCGIALVYNSILEPFLGFIAVTTGIIDAGSLPQIKDELIYPVLIGMLGLGGMRTYEKRHNMAREHLQSVTVTHGSVSDDADRLRNGLSSSGG